MKLILSVSRTQQGNSILFFVARKARPLRNSKSLFKAPTVIFALDGLHVVVSNTPSTLSGTRKNVLAGTIVSSTGTNPVGDGATSSFVIVRTRGQEVVCYGHCATVL